MKREEKWMSREMKIHLNFICFVVFSYYSYLCTIQSISTDNTSAIKRDGFVHFVVKWTSSLICMIRYLQKSLAVSKMLTLAQVITNL